MDTRSSQPPPSRLRAVWLSTVLVLMVAAPVWAGLQEVETLERSFTVEGVAEIYVRNVDGRTAVRAHDGSTVHVKAVKQVRRAASDAEAEEAAGKVQVIIEQTGNRIEVETKYPKRGFPGSGPQVYVHIEVSAPARSNLDIRSVDGPLDVTGFEGELLLHTVDGDLTVEGCAGRIDASSIDGDAELRHARGHVEAKTVDGDLNIDGMLATVQATSTDGDIVVEVESGTVMEGDWSIRTSDGSVRLHLPDGFAANLDVRTGDGDIETDHPLTLEGNISRNQLRGQLNGGGHLLTIRTSDGSVELRRR